ncbi:hypothetical protein IAR50_007319 [Cryptococcus sp. DSM 104548]
MSLDLSRFPPNSSIVGSNSQDDGHIDHMCYCAMHLDLSESKGSVADWIASGKALHQGNPVNLITFEDGTSTILCTGCGTSAVSFALGTHAPEAHEAVIGNVTRESMEKAGIYEDYKNTFRETVSIHLGALDPEGQFVPFIEGNPGFLVDKETMTDPDTITAMYQEFIGSQTYDESALAEAVEWEQDWEVFHGDESG